MELTPTDMLGELDRGNRVAAEQLFVLVYDDLRRLAAHHLQGERRGHTLQPTALVHEAYLRLIDQSRVGYRGQVHFKAMAAEMIRRILIDHGRARAALKRGGDRTRISLDDAECAPGGRGGGGGGGGSEIDVLDLDEAMTELATLSPRQAKVVDLKCFGGLDIAEIASVLQISETLVKNEWRFAKAWLMDRLRDRP